MSIERTIRIVAAAYAMAACDHPPTASDWPDSVALKGSIGTPDGMSVVVRRNSRGLVQFFLRNETGATQRVWFPNSCAFPWYAVAAWPGPVSGAPRWVLDPFPPGTGCPDILGGNAPIGSEKETELEPVSDVPAGWRVVVVYSHNGRRVVVPLD